MRVVVITGYVSIPGHPRSDEQYERLGAQLCGIRAAPVRPFRCELKDCWLDEHVRDRNVGHAVGDNPKKNTLAYHVVQHQKTAWLLQAVETDPLVDVVVWVDYGVLHQPGVTTNVIDDFLRRILAISRSAIDIPGAWERSRAPRSHDSPDWRFCGSSLVMSRDLVARFHDAVREVTLERLASDGRVTWEVNDWAEVERRGGLPVRWYKADHNQTQFTNF